MLDHPCRTDGCTTRASQRVRDNEDRRVPRFEIVADREAGPWCFTCALGEAGRLRREAITESPAARSTDPETSHEAARRVTESGVRQGHAERVLAAVRAHPGMTSRELAGPTGLERHEVARRLADLANAGLVEQQDARPCSVGRGRAVTWRVIEGAAVAAAR